MKLNIDRDGKKESVNISLPVVVPSWFPLAAKIFFFLILFLIVTVTVWSLT